MMGPWVAVQHCQSASLYIDNISVVPGLQRLQKYGWQPAFWEKHKEGIQWYRIWRTLQDRNVENWKFCHVKSHRDIACQQTFHVAWTATGNDAAAADRAAKYLLLNIPADVRNAHSRACSEVAAQSSRLARVFTLQVRLLQHKSPARQDGVTQRTVAQPYEPVLRIPVQMVPATSLPNQSAPMPERFMWVLRMCWFQQDWYECPDGYSLAEFYSALTLQTGWLTPVNVASWKQDTLPYCWRSKLLAAFVH